LKGTTIEFEDRLYKYEGFESESEDYVRIILRDLKTKEKKYMYMHLLK